MGFGRRRNRYTAKPENISTAAARAAFNGVDAVVVINVVVILFFHFTKPELKASLSLVVLYVNEVRQV